MLIYFSLFFPPSYNITIHKATFPTKLADIAKEKKYSLSVDAAIEVKEMNAKKLILTHISTRYQKNTLKLSKEAKEIFPNTVLAENLLRIELK